MTAFQRHREWAKGMRASEGLNVSQGAKAEEPAVALERPRPVLDAKAGVFASQRIASLNSVS